jgi:GPH family glycoside/pentoside/hexuronide:cation symporter
MSHAMASAGDVSTPALGRGAMIAWGVGTLGPVTVLTATNALLLRYLTDIYGLAAGLAASLIAISKFYDVFADVAMGVVSDRTRSRWGRRRPYLILGSLCLGVSIVAIFGAPAFAHDRARILYMGAILIFYATAYSLFNVPYMAMPGEMTRTYHERSDLMSWRVYAVGLAIMLASFGGPRLLDAFGGAAPAYLGMAWVFAPLVIVAGVVTFVGTAKTPSRAAPTVRAGAGRQIATVLANRPFLILMVVKFLTLMSLGSQAIFPFFFQRILGVSNNVLGNYFFSQSAMYLAGPPLWLWLSRRVGKKATFLVALAISVPGWLSWELATRGEPHWAVYLRGVIIGVSGGGVILMGQSMLPDTMEWDFLRTGLRREGLLAALYTTVEKLSGAVGVALVGAVLGWSGYLQSRGAGVAQPVSALAPIRFIMGFIPAGVSFAGILALLFYRLDERQLTGAADPTTAGVAA